MGRAAHPRDILQIASKEKIILGIDYFSRKIFIVCNSTKETSETLELIKSVYNEI